MYKIIALFTYPVKSFQAIESPSLTIDDFGPRYDRRFMLIDEQGMHVTQRSDPKMAAINAQFDGRSLSITAPRFEFTLSLDDFTQPTIATVWSDQVSAYALKESENNSTALIDSAMSELLDKAVRLVYMPDTACRPVDPEFSLRPSRVSFSDGFPFLLCNTASLGDLNARLDRPVSMGRFRPNIVFDGGSAFEESEWKRVRINNVEFDVAKPCSRCSMITLDGAGRFNKEPLKTLAGYRRNKFGACFGENLVHRGHGAISVGSMLEILE